MIFPKSCQRRKEVITFYSTLAHHQTVLHTASANSFSLSSGASLVFPGNAGSPPCWGCIAERAGCSVSSGPAFACVSAGSRWTVLLCGAIQSPSHHPASWGHAAPATSADQQKTPSHHSFYLCSSVRAQENRFWDGGGAADFTWWSVPSVKPDPPLLQYLHNECF